MSYKFLIIPIIFIFTASQLGDHIIAFAQTADDLKSKISDKGNEIRALEVEIDRLDKEVKNTQSKRQTLSTELRQIDAVKKRLDVDVKITAKKIDITDLNIKSTENSIDDKSGRIASGKAGISESVRIINMSDIDSLPEIILSGSNLSAIWSKISDLETLQNKTVTHINELHVLRSELENSKVRLQSEKDKAISLRNQLADQRKIAQQNIESKNKLIADTKNRESNFYKLLNEAEKRKADVERELLQYESELRIVLDPNKLPSAGKKVLAWPLDLVHITQYFGLTEFSKTQSIYNGRGHNGIDLRASMGTALRSAADGIVLGAGDTDPVCYGASYGKWVMIDHNNGLASIYGHLSLIKVSAGQNVKGGDLIGYTGKSGYSTGPHLHFSVVATQAVQIGKLKSKVKGCGTYTIPLGAFNGYLNPLLYL